MSDVARVGEDEAQRIFSAENMSLLLNCIKPHLEPDKKKLVYLMPQANRIGHFAMESHQLYNLHHREFDEILVIINPSTEYHFNGGIRAIAERYVTFIESPNSGMTRMGFFDGPSQDFGPFTLALDSAGKIARNHYNSLKRGVPPVFFEAPDALLGHGRSFLQAQGVADEAPIVCLHHREPTYLADQTYHSFRNSRFETYVPAIDWLIDQGHVVVRLGDQTSTPISPARAGLIDLPFAAGYTDTLDAALIALSQFSITCSSGPESLCRMLGAPMLQCNTPVVSSALHNPVDVLMFKHYRDISQDRVLSYEEILDRRLWIASTTAFLDDAGVRIEENSADEILEGVKEISDRLTGRFSPDPSIDQRFQALGRQYEDVGMAAIAPGEIPDFSDYMMFLGYSLDGITVSHSYCRRNPGFLGLE